MDNLIDGNAVSKQIQEELKVKLASIQGRKACVAFIRVGKAAANSRRK